ncbi:hypothetical protein [Flavobacterium olei]|uniref:hypothetical protein n=1 Tax=Flavobacterium olei TaxID=1886782 RepID=UPI003218F8A1
MKNKVFIYGLCDVFYDGYYIRGINEVFKNYTFDISKFPKFKQGTFAVIIENENGSTKLIIDSLDSNLINSEWLNWSDVYGKVNYNADNIPLNDSQKIIPVGPSFGIKIWNLITTCFFASFNIIKFKKSITNQREFLANYWRQYKRFRLEKYKFEESSNHYVFFMNSIWKEEKKTNYYRALFINVCRANKEINFEGGFAARSNGDNLGFDSLIYSGKIPLNTYLQKIKKSAFVFNTPAVLSCHGWKLGEFLALGKAIISTDHINRLPSDLINGEHLLYANNEDDVKNAVQLLSEDIDFKRKLEFNSRNYFDSYLAPKVVIEKLISNIQ